MQVSLAQQAQRLLLVTNQLLSEPAGMLLANWPERAGALYGSHVVSTKTVTGLTGGYLAGTIEDNANFRPPVGDMIPDPDAYLKRVGGMRSLNAYLDTFPRRVREHEAAGMDLADAIGQEKRALQGLAIGDPYRTWRKITEDVTTANVNPMWRGWVRVPEPGACAFCRMLATRGAVYTENSGNFRSHNRCRCTARAALDEGAAAYINAEGASAWQEMLATGDVPKLSPELRRRGAFTQQRVDEINKRLTNLANAQRASELRVARNRELGIKRTPAEHGRDGYRAKLIREYRDERSTILNATKGNPPRTRKGSQKIKDQQGVDTTPQTHASGGSGGGSKPPRNPTLGGVEPDGEDLRKIAEQIRSNAAARGPKIRDEVVAVAASLDGVAVRGVDSFLKVNVDRMVEKLQRRQRTTSRPIAPDAEFIVNDSVRFRLVGQSESYWTQADAIIDELTASGFRLEKVFNGWDSPFPYKGLNVTMLDRDGLPFEIQIHTTQSVLAAESKESRRLYEASRNAPRSERRRLDAANRAIWDRVPRPRGGLRVR